MSTAPAKPGAIEEQTAPRTNALGRRELPRIKRLVIALASGVTGKNRSICTQVYTQDYMEKLVSKHGAAALAACRKEVATATVRVAVVRIERVAVTRSPDGSLSGHVQVLQRINDDGLLRTKMTLVGTQQGYRISGLQGEQVKADKPSGPAFSP